MLPSIVARFWLLQAFHRPGRSFIEGRYNDADSDLNVTSAPKEIEAE